jgi:hypothetical protein
VNEAVEPVTPNEALEVRVETTLERLFRPLLDRLAAKVEKPPQEWYSVQQTAAITGLSPKHIRRAIRRGELSCSDLGSGKRSMPRVARQDIENWFKANRLKQAPSKSERDALADHYFGRRRKSKPAAA